jgi:hypothetical protein
MKSYPQRCGNIFGKHHYSWAVRQLLANLALSYPPRVTCPREFVFHWLERNDPVRKEMEEIMDQNAVYF